MSDMEKDIGTSTYEFLPASVRRHNRERSRDRSLFGTLRRTDLPTPPCAQQKILQNHEQKKQPHKCP